MGSWTPHEVHGPVYFLLQEICRFHLFNTGCLHCLLCESSTGNKTSSLPPMILRCFSRDTGNSPLTIHSLLSTSCLDGTALGTESRTNRISTRRKPKQGQSGEAKQQKEKLRSEKPMANEKLPRSEAEAQRVLIQILFLLHILVCTASPTKRASTLSRASVGTEGTWYMAGRQQTTAVPTVGQFAYSRPLTKEN